MKTEINLRTREFAVNREFYWPRLLRALAVILLVVLFIGGSLFVYLYQMQLTVANNYLTQEKTSLQAKVAPVEEMEAMIRDLENRERLSGNLLKGVFSRAAYFGKINDIAKGSGLRTTSLESSNSELIRVSGNSETMRQVALFMQALEEEDIFGAAVYKNMTFVEDKRIDYVLELILSGGGGQ